MIAAEARVNINSRTGTLIITGDVEIRPGGHQPERADYQHGHAGSGADAAAPITKTRDLVGIDTVSQGPNARLQDLMAGRWSNC